MNGLNLLVKAWARLNLICRAFCWGFVMNVLIYGVLNCEMSFVFVFSWIGELLMLVY